jgi:hypothetical protein
MIHSAGLTELFQSLGWLADRVIGVALLAVILPALPGRRPADSSEDAIVHR